MIIMKFGGTSVRNAKAMHEVANIVKFKLENGNRILLVLSAAAGITNKLINLGHSAIAAKEDVPILISDIKNHHLNIAKEAIRTKSIYESCQADINELCDELSSYIKGVILLAELTPRMLDKIQSFGELLSTSIFTYILKDQKISTQLLDSRSIIKTNSEFSQAKLNIDASKEQFSTFNLSEEASVFVAQGFIASDQQGRTTTLGRGGSDYSAAIYGILFKTSEIEIWTDVSGVYTADPRLVKEAKALSHLSYKEIRAMSFFGAKVIHPDTIKAAIDIGINVRVLNTFEPESKGTLITGNGTNIGLKSIVLRESCKIIELDRNEDISGEKLLMDFSTVDSRICIYDKDAELTAKEIDLLIFCGNKPEKSKILKSIGKIRDYKYDIISLTDMIILKVEKDKGKELLPRLHNSLF